MEPLTRQISSELDQNASLSAFVSYAREDEAFARLLAATLESSQITVRADWLLEPGPDFRSQLRNLILTSDVFVLVITPASIQSTECMNEVQFAETLNKRIQPVLHRDIADTSGLGVYIRTPQWAYVRQLPADAAAVEKLQAAIQTDFSMMQMHTFLLGRAKDWSSAGRSSNSLLRGGELRQAEAWLTVAVNARRLPNPTTLQSEFVAASRARRLRTLRTMGVSAVFLAGALSFTAFEAWRNASVARAAMAARLATASKELQARAPHELPQAVLLAIEAVRRAPSAQADDALRSAAGILPSLQGETSASKRFSALAMSRDGQFIAAGNDDFHVRVWSVADLAAPVMDGQHEGTVNAVAFSPDGEYLATGSLNKLYYEDSPPDHSVRIWNLKLRKQIFIVKDARGLADFKFSPDGQHFLVVPFYGTVRVWRMPSLTELMPIPGTTAPVDISPDGRLLAAVSNENVSLWDLHEHRHVAVVPHRARVIDVTFSPDGHRLATVSNDSTLRIWGIRQSHASRRRYVATEVARANLRGFATGIRFSPSGRYIATLHPDEFALWIRAIEEAGTKVTLRDITQIHANKPFNTVDFNLTDLRVVTAGGDGTSRIYDTFTGEELTRAYHDAAVVAIAQRNNADVLATAGDDGKVKIWRAAIQHLDPPITNDLTWRPDPAYGGPDTVEEVASTGLGRYQILHTLGSGTQLWEAQKYLRTLRSHNNVRVLAVAAGSSEDTATIVTDQAVESIQWSSDTTVRRCCEAPGYYIAAAVSRDAQFAAIATTSELLVWNISRGQTVARRSLGGTRSVAFSSDNSIVAIGDHERVRLWTWAADIDNVNNVTEVAAAGHVLAFAENSPYLAVGSQYDVSIWNYAQPVPSRLRHIQFAQPAALMFIDGANLLFVGGGSHELTEVRYPAVLWQWTHEAGGDDVRLDLPRPVRSVARLDGESILVGLVAGGARILPLKTETVQKEACGRLNRNLSPTEWSNYLPPPRLATCPNLP